MLNQRTCAIALLIAVLALSAFRPSAALPGEDARPRNRLIELWSRGTVAFGVFAPDENTAARAAGVRRPPVHTRAGGVALAGNPLIDFVFLNLEGGYNATAIEAIAEGLRTAASRERKALLVRIPSVHDAGPKVTRAHVREALALGADGVVVPHVSGVGEAEQVIEFFREADANVWSPANPGGTVLAMLMIEDPRALAEAQWIAGLPDYSILACGIGSLTQALGGDRAAAEAATQQILAHTRRMGLANMLTATSDDVETRVREGFLGLIAIGPDVEETLRRGRAAAGR